VAATSAQNSARLDVTEMNELAETTEAAWMELARCTTGVDP
jgi:hypothetical protein